MSIVSWNSKSNRLAAFVRRVLFWQRNTRPQHAHPWSAYKPATYLAGAAPTGIIMATRAQHLLKKFEPCATAVASIEAATTNLANIASIDSQPQPATSPHAPIVVAEIERPKATLRVVAPSAAPAAPALPGLSAWTGQNFQFAARLKSVSKLNRSINVVTMTATGKKTTATPTRISAQNRIARMDHTGVRRTTIQPPAVLRPERKSAQILEFKSKRATRLLDHRVHRIA